MYLFDKNDAVVKGTVVGIKTLPKVKYQRGDYTEYKYEVEGIGIITGVNVPGLGHKAKIGDEVMIKLEVQYTTSAQDYNKELELDREEEELLSQLDTLIDQIPDSCVDLGRVVTRWMEITGNDTNDITDHLPTSVIDNCVAQYKSTLNV